MSTLYLREDVPKKTANMQKKRIYSYEKSTQVCHLIRSIIFKTLIVQIVSVHFLAVMI